MGAWPPSHMQSLIFARICLHGELGMWPLNLLTKVMYLTSESLLIIDASDMQQMKMVAMSHYISSPHFYPLTGCARRGRRAGL